MSNSVATVHELDEIDIALQTRHFNPTNADDDLKSYVYWCGAPANFVVPLDDDARKLVVYSEISTTMTMSKLRTDDYHQVGQENCTLEVPPGLSVMCLCKFLEDSCRNTCDLTFRDGYAHYTRGADQRVQYVTVSRGMMSRMSTIIVRKFLIRELSPEEFLLQPEWRQFPTAMLLRYVMYSDLQIRVLMFNKNGKHDWVCYHSFIPFKVHDRLLPKGDDCLMTNSDKLRMCIKLNCEAYDVRWEHEEDFDNVLFCKIWRNRKYDPVFCEAHEDYRSRPPVFDFTPEEVDLPNSWDDKTVLSGPNPYSVKK